MIWIQVVFTVVSAIATAFLVTSTIAFHRWSRRQRNPKPGYLSGLIVKTDEKACAFAVVFSLSNTGDIPMIVAGAAIRLCFESSCFSALSFTPKVEEYGTREEIKSGSIPARGAAYVIFDVDFSTRDNIETVKNEMPNRVDVGLLLPSYSITGPILAFRTSVMAAGKHGVLIRSLKMSRLRRRIRRWVLPKFMRELQEELLQILPRE